MLNKNYSDVVELAKSILATVKKLKSESVNIDAENIKVTLYVDKTELNTIDRELYELTKEYNPGKEFIPSDNKIIAKLGGIDFTIKTENADKETVVTITEETTDYPTVVETVTITKEDEPVIEEAKEEKKAKETKKATKADTKKVEKSKPKKK